MLYEKMQYIINIFKFKTFEAKVLNDIEGEEIKLNGSISMPKI